ncbi:malectin/receptor-like protein kinase family protein [Actinidia rufa]|uniref:Malectin/receptor-like protein kinase family protein n=1 Tax=Actinidia rufa TaxID=165716 RepID=A0A7J0EKF2_9ERIC|nr:malectin/receptor-like protein kinase family protein [Actinidia rufa]
MSLCPLPFIISLYFFFHHLIIPVAGALYYPLDNIAVNCGFSNNSTAADGRQWIGDSGSKYVTSHGSKEKLISSITVDRLLSPDPVPYKTARISRSQFTYTFQVSPGIKFIRLHFYPTSYRGFKRSKAFFTVKAGPYTLLSNFSAALTSDALGLPSFAKEFCANVEENQRLIISFTPSQGSSTDKVYAFVNGIEVISMPTGLYHTLEGAHVVGKKHQFSIDKNIALEKAYRLNIGGSSILSLQDTGMFREWSGDSNYLLESSVLPASTTSRIKYTNIPAYIAPQKVYQTSWSIVPDKQAIKTFNFTWKLPVDLGFRYLLRFHFCELEYEIKESGNTRFSIFVNEEVAEAKADITKWSGRNGVAVYRDYLVTLEGDRMEGKRDLLIALCPHKIDNYDWNEQIDAILKGLEVFKLSNHDKNLAGVNPVPLVRASTSGKPNPRKLVFSSGGNAIATGVVVLLSLVNIIAYKLRLLSEKVGEKDLSSLPSERLCRRFSLAEILSVTNNFDDELVVGRGGFGKVYKALIDGGETSVAIKRLNLKSRQGADEFWTEIEMLSNLRHTHLVSLIGYCDERSEMILVYEYMEYGTLADHLYKINTDGSVTSLCHLSWEQRVRICIGAARGLDYLHTGTRHGIIHRDVKSTNILLDEEWVSKISDLGLCKTGSTSHSRSHVSTEVKGTLGYLDPEYFLTRRLTKKSDVYAFGVVMLEVLCGRPAVVSGIDEDQRSLVLWAQQCMKEKTLDLIIHPILREQIMPKRLMMFAEVAIKCLHSRPNERPTMANILVSLECALASNDASDDQCRVSSSEEEEEEEDINVAGAVDEQIDENIQDYDALPVASLLFTSIPVQYNENSHRQKRSKGMFINLIQRSLAFLAKGLRHDDMISESKSKSAYASPCSSAYPFSRSCLRKNSVVVRNMGQRNEEIDEPRLDARNGELRDSISEELKLHIMEKKIRVEKAAGELLKNYQKKVGYEFNFGNAEEFGNDDEDDEDDAASYASSDLFELDNLSSIGIEKSCLSVETRYLNANNREMCAPNEAQNSSDNPDPLPLQSKAPCQLFQFTFEELKSATGNFRPDNILGEGRFGSAFKGWIEENGTAPAKPGTGITVTVKRLAPYYLQEQSECEVSRLSALD